MKYCRAVVLWTAMLACGYYHPVSSAPASSRPHQFPQPDGTQTPYLFLSGDERYSWLSDENGFTVLRNADNWYVYAHKTEDGNLEALNAKVGDVDPTMLGLKPNLHHDSAFWEDNNNDDNDDDEMGILRLRRQRKLPGMPQAILCDHEASTVDPCYLKQLALMVRFADHEGRNLPSPEDINVLFNHNGPTGTNTAPTGSISDVYRANSFDRLVLDTHVSGWIQISKTEAYCSGGQNGFNLAETRECWAEALEKYAETLGEDGLKMYDGDGDGYIDGMAIVHSGVGAEESGEDCETKALYNNRIWSHSVPQAPNFEFTSEFGKDVGVKAGRFYVISSVYGTCPVNGAGTKWDTGRIAVGVHEGGHFLGLKDLYGKPGVDYGIGNWGFMGNMFGWDVSGSYPGMMSGYSRHLLGWMDVIDVTYSQVVTVISSCDSDKIYRITHRMASDEFGDEYFLIENRQACGHDVKLLHDGLDRQGIVIWHVDHTGLLGQVDGQDIIRFNTAKAPTSPEWPKMHSRVSILQGDGSFDLENNVNRGDEFDSFRVQAGASSVAKMISSSGVTMNDGTVKKYPNTNSIAYGDERESGITIEVLDSPQNAMRVKVTLFDSNGDMIENPPDTVTKPADIEVETPPVQSVPKETSPAVETEAPQQQPADTSSSNGTTNTQPESNSNSETNSITQIGGDTASVFNQFSFSGAQNNDSTQAPAVDSPTEAPLPAETTKPEEEYSCDNSEYEEFEVTGLGENPSMNIIKQCQFIKPDKRDPMEWCNAPDLWNNNKPVYVKCQRECNIITGCPAPVDDDAAETDKAAALNTSTKAPVANPTDAPVAKPTDAPVAKPTDAPIAKPTDAPLAKATDAPIAKPTDAPVAKPTDAPTEPIIAPRTESSPPEVAQPTNPPTKAPLPAPTNAPVSVPTEDPVPVVTTPPTAKATEPPVVTQTQTPIASTTEAPQVVENTTVGEYSCDNSKYEEFEVTGLGENPSMNIIKQCQFIKPDKRDPMEWCNALDMWNNNQPVFNKCQRECNIITGCPPPEPDETRRYLRH